MVFPSQFILSHFVADHAFTNANKISKFGKLDLIKHWIWVILILLAFTFDTLLKMPKGVLLISTYIIAHMLVDLFRKRNFVIAELIGLSVAFFLNVVAWKYLLDSYITPEFSTYILGMTMTSAVPTTVFRCIGMIPLESNDSDGIFERLLAFVLVNASQYLWVFVIFVMVLVYRLLFMRFSKYWIISPIVGLTLSIIWKIIIYG